jgi:O-acetyl-ADP-ribose deacetylase (regulator of RNase III)
MIEYLVGDATDPVGTGTKIIAHICNDVGAFGAGFVVPLGQKFPLAKSSYLAWAMKEDLIPFRLGRMTLVRCEEPSPRIFVANMIAQEGCGWNNGVPPIRYNALEDCLAELVLHARSLNASVHMPRIGCGLAGGTWDKVEPLISKHLHDIDVKVYDLPKEKHDDNPSTESE